jgi:superfamily II DNA/RNA helicase
MPSDTPSTDAAELQAADADTAQAAAAPPAPDTADLTFADLGLGPKLLSVLSASGYTQPTPIQQQAIPPALQGRDVLGIAQTGTGKTAAFALPMIERLSKGRARARMPRSLVLAPTRELAAQVADQFKKYGKDYKLTMALLIGGVSFGDQEKVLNAGADIIIATPGRLLDMFERGKVMLRGVEIMVVDEADRMLDMGFIPDVERIFKLTPFTRQTLFFSATMPKEIQHLVDAFLQAPVRVEAARPATTASTIDQRLVRVRDREPKAKRQALRDAIDTQDVKNAIVFCNRKRDVDVVARSLQRHDYSAAQIHGDLPQSERMATLKRFRDGDLRLLVASDVAARGLDIPDVSHVFNYDPPHSPDDYVHRIGRTGRAGRQGASITIAGPEDSKKLKAIEDMLGGPIPPLVLKGVHAVKEAPKPAKSAEAATVDEAIEAAASAPAPETGAEGDEASAGEERTGRRRGRRGRSRGKSDAPAETQAEAAETGAETATAPRAKPEARAEPKPRRERQPREQQVREHRIEEEEEPGIEAALPEDIEDIEEEPQLRRAGGVAAPQRRGGGPTGFGDHVPAFVTRSVKERLTEVDA